MLDYIIVFDHPQYGEKVHHVPEGAEGDIRGLLNEFRSAYGHAEAYGTVMSIEPAAVSTADLIANPTPTTIHAAALRLDRLEAERVRVENLAAWLNSRDYFVLNDIDAGAAYWRGFARARFEASDQIRSILGEP